MAWHRNKVFIIAELSANHNQDLQTALDTIDAIAESGADAVKLQTYTASTITLDSDKPDFIIDGTIWEGRKLHDLYKEAYTPWEWHEQLFRHAESKGLTCFSSPFDITAVDFLEKLNAPLYKIASFEITDIPLITYAASKGKPMIISTGIATYEDIQLAVNACRKAGNNDITLLKCTSAYPAPFSEANLSLIPKLKTDFGVEAGLSDHTPGSTLPVLSVAFGAKVIEKHVILDRNMGGPDSSFSMNKEEFAEMVKAVRDAEQALGNGSYDLSPKQQEGKQFARSLYVSRNIVKGEHFSAENIRSVRPGYGLHPKYYEEILGRTATRDLESGDRLTETDIADFTA